MPKTSKPWLLVANPDYFRGVINSMIRMSANARHDLTVTVRFGLEGKGNRPNYQVEMPPDRAQAIRSSDHKPDPMALGGRYEEHNLSEERFTLVEVQQLLADSLIKAA